VYRIDVVAPDEEKPNPPDAHVLGLPPRIIGTHAHAWEDNRSFVEQNGFAELPYRRPLQVPEPTLRNTVMALAEGVRITITGEQRASIEPPKQPALF
jgi:hypothetical protein